MRYSFLLVLCASGLSQVGCGSDAKLGSSMQPSMSQNDSDDGVAGTQGAHAGNGNVDNGNPGNANGGTSGHDANNGGASEGGVSNGGASSSNGGASSGGVAGDSSSGSSGTGGVPVDPNPPGSSAGADGGSPDDPPPSSVDGGPGFVACKAEMRGAFVCPDIYFAVCGEVNTGIVCIQAPCPTFEYHVFSNSCEACANENVVGYWVGTCADNGK